jgi:hypothetical protein
MKELTQKILRSAGILAAIGAVGGLVITGVNAWTSPIIAANDAEKVKATYKVVFADLTDVSDPVTISGKDYLESYVIAKKDGNELGWIFTGTASYGQTVNMKIMVGMSTANGATVLGKVAILNNGATGGYDTTVVDKYVTPYNAAPSDTTLEAVKCGATAAATSIKMIVSAAKDFYETGSEDIAGEIKGIFAEEAAYAAPVEVKDATYAKKYYAVYSDAAKANYIGTVYRFDGSDSAGTSLTLMGGVSGSIGAPVYGKIFAVKSSADITADVTAYNAAPSASQFDSWSAAASGVLAKAMMAEGVSLYTSGTGNLTEEGSLPKLYPTAKAYSGPTDVSGQGSVSKYWIAYADAAKTSELGYAFYGSSSESFDVDGETHTATITLLSAISGTGAAPLLGKIAILKDTSFVNTGITGDYVTNYNANPSDATLDATANTGATHSASVIKTIVTDARKAFVSIKGGN